MKRILFITLIALAAISVSCNKQKMIEKNLYQKSGIWDIDKMTIITGGQTITDINVGTWTFKENGTGSRDLKDGYTPKSISFIYTNTEKLITINYTDGTTRNYTMDWEKDKIELDTSDGTYSENWQLTKRK